MIGSKGRHTNAGHLLMRLFIVILLVNQFAGTAVVTKAADSCDVLAFKYGPPTSFKVGSQPRSIVDGDFNGDGKLDLATANQGSDTVSVAIGNGDGTFQSPSNYSVGLNSHPVFVVVGDFNSDGKADLATANINDSTISILLGNGDGTFRRHVKYAAVGDPTSLAVGDFNGDGKVDLATANTTGNNVSILLGNGDGTFLPPVNYNVGLRPNFVMVGDFNGDNKLDLALTNQFSNDVSILLGVGNGTFQPATNYGVGPQPVSIAVGDFNGDNKLDLAVTKIFFPPMFLSDSHLSVLLGKGDGSFQPALEYPIGYGYTPTFVATGDFNEDGKLDLAVTYVDGGLNGLLIFRGIGDGSFQQLGSFGTGGNPQTLVVGDFNRDGKADIALADYFTKEVWILPGNGDCTFRSQVNYSVGGYPDFLQLGDFNGDGKVDLVVSNNSSESLFILPGKGDGTFQATPGYGFGFRSLSVAVGDFNRDGKLDLAIGMAEPVGGGNLAILLGKGDGSFLAPHQYAVGLSPFAVVVGDFNIDGQLDLAVGNTNDGTVSVLMGNGDGSFQTAVNYSVGTNPASLAVGDFNGDGKLDLAVANNGDFFGSTPNNLGNVSILIGKGDGSFEQAVNYDAGSNPRSVAVADFNGDGIPDLAVANQDHIFNIHGATTCTPKDVSILLGKGDGTFRPAVNYGVGSNPRWVTVGDMNGDGIADLVVADGCNSTFSLLFGNGDGTFRPKISYELGVDGKTVAVGDFNGDGKPDIAVVPKTFSGMVSILLFSSCSPSPGNVSESFSVPAGGASTGLTQASSGPVQAGYATVTPNTSNIYGTAVFSLTQNGVIVSEAGVPASPPSIITNGVKFFIDFRNGVSGKSHGLDATTSDINTGFAIANLGTRYAGVNYYLKDKNNLLIAQGSELLPPGSHRARFINELTDIGVPLVLPGSFSTATQFGTLLITADVPMSILPLRLTTNQRGETLITSTPIADLGKPNPPLGVLYFPQMADGGGYQTTLVLGDISFTGQSVTIQFFNNQGQPLAVRRMGDTTAQSQFAYDIPPGGFIRLITDGSPTTVQVGWVMVTTTRGRTPFGASLFGFTQNGILVTETGVSSVEPTTHARIYVDLSNGHNTGLAIGNPGIGPLSLTLKAYQTDGVTQVGATANPPPISPNGHISAFVEQLVSGLPPNFTGVLDISSTTPFVALTLRSLTNTRGDFLLTTFPIADFNQSAPSPIVFPQIADGGGYMTQFIFLSTSGATNTTLNFFDDNGLPLAVGKSEGGVRK